MAAIARASAAWPGGDSVRRRFHLAGGGDEQGDERLATCTWSAATCTIRQGGVGDPAWWVYRDQEEAEAIRAVASRGVTGGTVVPQAANQQGTRRYSRERLGGGLSEGGSGQKTTLAAA